MHRYDFEVSRESRVVYCERGVMLPNDRSAWGHVQLIADHVVTTPGARIRVADEDGQIIILTGVVSAQRVSNARCHG